MVWMEDLSEVLWIGWMSFPPELLLEYSISPISLVAFFSSSWPRLSGAAPVRLFPLITSLTLNSFCFISSAPCCFFKPLTFFYCPFLSSFSPWIDPSSTVSASSCVFGFDSPLESVPPIKSWFKCSLPFALMDVGMFFICLKNTCFMRTGWVFFSGHRCAELSLYLFLFQWREWKINLAFTLIIAIISRLAV